VDEAVVEVRDHRVETRMWLPQTRSEVFPFFADAHNVESITPPWLAFSVLTPAPIEMRAGALIEYRLRLHGVTLRWRTEIAVWEPPARFVDRQVAGPYETWEHEHRFRDVAGGVVMSDHIGYRIRGGGLGDLIGDIAVARRDLRRIFEYRRDALRARFGAGPAYEPA
jgi:ligand-binding SRPBCC domain-containing protein